MKNKNIALYVGGLILVGIIWYESRSKISLAQLQQQTANSSGRFTPTTAPIVSTLVEPSDTLDALDSSGVSGSF